MAFGRKRMVGLALLAVCAGLPSVAWSLCTSDGVVQPTVVIERFMSADCDTCWKDPATPEAAAGALALDWVVPGEKGDDAPLSTVASRDALERLKALKRSPPQASETVSTRRSGKALPLRAALGDAFNDYIGASIELKGASGTPRQAWLLLVETLPAGTEGSPVARNLVRNVFQPSWDRPSKAKRLYEMRAMQIHEGARPERLKLVALLQDARGRMRAITQTECRE
jgi:hypothetical protein